MIQVDLATENTLTVVRLLAKGQKPPPLSKSRQPVITSPSTRARRSTVCIQSMGSCIQPEEALPWPGRCGGPLLPLPDICTFWGATLLPLDDDRIRD